MYAAPSPACTVLTLTSGCSQLTDEPTYNVDETSPTSVKQGTANTGKMTNRLHYLRDGVPADGMPRVRVGAAGEQAAADGAIVASNNSVLSEWPRSTIDSHPRLPEERHYYGIYVTLMPAHTTHMCQANDAGVNAFFKNAAAPAVAQPWPTAMASPARGG